MSRSTVRTSSRNGFTLVELLVVIAIIGILVALLLPAGAGGPGGGSAHVVPKQSQASGDNVLERFSCRRLA